ncbi:hypothetical protein [Xylocopilactobacillus apis]|uniref:hypothetical protein n=1 Tax=Xylocopilactobacillus apis TaxID=2932183 RepID=UPI00295456ED|nr:hypothetical protein [Xylocopilactobacillus apis]
MKHNIIHNRFWFFTGLETLVLGAFFLFAPDILDSGELRQFFDVLDTTLPAIFLIVVGTFTVVNSAFEVEPDWHRANVFLLEFIWAFYTAIFVAHDIQGGDRPIISLTSILFCAVSLQIFFESWWGDRLQKKEVKARHDRK